MSGPMDAFKVTVHAVPADEQPKYDFEWQQSPDGSAAAFVARPTNEAAKRDVARAIQRLAEHFGISETEAAEALLAACLQPKWSPNG
jgi:cell pole-organizing protein PopZ